MNWIHDTLKLYRNDTNTSKKHLPPVCRVCLSCVKCWATQQTVVQYLFIDIEHSTSYNKTHGVQAQFNEQKLYRIECDFKMPVRKYRRRSSEISSCLKYIIFGVNVLFWVNRAVIHIRIVLLILHFIRWNCSVLVLKLVVFKYCIYMQMSRWIGVWWHYAGNRKLLVIMAIPNAWCSLVSNCSF